MSSFINNEWAFTIGYILGLGMPIFTVGNNLIDWWTNDDTYTHNRFGGTGAGGGTVGDYGKAPNWDIDTTKLGGYDDKYTGFVGRPGTQTGGGKGFYEGKFGYGGGNSNNTIDMLYCGGGGGWYGGGSSYLNAGAGGGSGYVYRLGAVIPDGYPVDTRYMATGDIELSMNINHNNGYIVITHNSISTVYNYTGKAQKLTIEENGIYIIECYGAQGGGIVQNIYEYAGGLGGYAKAAFSLLKDDVVYLYIGQEGQYHSNAWNGGGGAGKDCMGGGGATDVRIAGNDNDLTDWYTTLMYRLIVAGGGGGISNYNDANDPSENPYYDNDSGNVIGDDSNVAESNDIMMLISDLTVGHCRLNYTCGESLTSDDKITVDLYVDGDKKSTSSLAMKSLGGENYYEFNFDDFLPIPTNPYYARVQMKISCNTDVVIPKSGITIWYTTKVRSTDELPPIDAKPNYGEIINKYKLRNVASLKMGTITQLSVTESESINIRNVYDGYIKPSQDDSDTEENKNGYSECESHNIVNCEDKSKHEIENTSVIEYESHNIVNCEDKSDHKSEKTGINEVVTTNIKEE